MRGLAALGRLRGPFKRPVLPKKTGQTGSIRRSPGLRLVRPSGAAPASRFVQGGFGVRVGPRRARQTPVRFGGRASVQRVQRARVVPCSTARAPSLKRRPSCDDPVPARRARETPAPARRPAYLTPPCHTYNVTYTHSYYRFHKTSAFITLLLCTALHPPTGLLDLIGL